MSLKPHPVLGPGQLRVRVDRERCQGHARCVAVASELFQLLRAADVILKERRQLILLARETPMHLGHLRLLVQIAEMGAIIMPPTPAFYHRPSTVEDIIDQTVNRALDMLDVELHHGLFARWQGPTARPGAARKIRDAAQGVLNNADIPS
jgi:hypothetical protein